MHLRFFLDSVEVSHPSNWRDVKIKYKRDDVVRGLFVLFTSELNFTGDAYSAIKAAFDSGMCGTMTALIEWRCGRYDSWTTCFEGNIEIRDVKIDRYACTAKAHIIESTASGVLFRNIDKEFDFQQAWTESASTVPPVDGNVTTTPSTLNPILQDTYTIFEDLISQASNGLAGFESDYFSTNTQPCIVRVEITSPPANGSYLELELLDMFGHTHYYKEIVNNTNPNDLISRLSKTFLVWDLAADAMFRHFSHCYVVDETLDTINHTGIWDLYFNFDVEIVSFTMTSGAGTATITQAYIDGAGQDGFAAGAAFNEDKVIIDFGTDRFFFPGENAISVREFFKNVSGIYDLGMRMEYIGGQWKVRIEPIEYFFEATPALSLTNVKGIVKSINKDMIGKLYRIGRNDDDGEEDTHEEERYFKTSNDSKTELRLETAINCDGDIDKTIEKRFYPLWGYYLSDSAVAYDDDGFYFVRLDDPQTIHEFEFTFWNTTVGPGQYNFRQYFGIPCHVEKILWNHRNSIPELTFYEGRYERYGENGQPWSLIATEPDANKPAGYAWTPYEYEFERYISRAEWLLIVSSQQITINQGDDPADEINAFIKEIEFSIYDGRTKFRLESDE